MSTETVGLLGMGAQDVHLDFYTAPELISILSSFNIMKTDTFNAFWVVLVLL